MGEQIWSPIIWAVLVWDLLIPYIKNSLRCLLPRFCVYSARYVCQCNSLLQKYIKLSDKASGVNLDQCFSVRICASNFTVVSINPFKKPFTSRSFFSFYWTDKINGDVVCDKPGRASNSPSIPIIGLPEP